MLTRWRDRGTLPADDEFIDWIDGPQVSIDTTTATAHLVESVDGIRIRVDVGTGPTDQACESRSLVRIHVALSGPLGERTIHDAGDTSYEPVINEVDSPETGLVYSCSLYGGAVGYTVPDLLGPGLEVPVEQAPPGAALADRPCRRRRGPCAGTAGGADVK